MERKTVIIQIVVLLAVSFSTVLSTVESVNSSIFLGTIFPVPNSYQRVPFLGRVRPMSRTNNIIHHSSSPTRSIMQTHKLAWVSSLTGVKNKRSFQQFSNCLGLWNTHTLPHKSKSSFLATPPFFAKYNDVPHSISMQQPEKALESRIECDIELPRSAHHWFTQSLPEGWCVGVCIDDSFQTTFDSTTVLLHPDEYQWGMENISSETSRTSYYLGRMALRLSLDTLLQRQVMDSMDAPDKYTFFGQLNDQIQSRAITKDSYGRPILPEIISGSISHKGGYAVGLATLRSSWKDKHKLGGIQAEMLDIGDVQWKEECPILDEDNVSDQNLMEKNCLSDTHGIGIDLERIDARRGKRIERKVLTESERSHLGGLEGIGISGPEEVVLRFSLKESVYKAIHPILCQYIGFQEAEITPYVDGTAKVTLNLIRGSHERLGIVVHTASWRKMGDFFLTSASVGVVPRGIDQ